MPTREMTREELLTEYLIQRKELEEIKKKYSQLVSYVCDYLYREIEIKRQSNYEDFVNFVKESEKQ